MDSYDKIAKIEKAIAKKYGASSVVNPKSGWDVSKEKKYLKDVKKFYKKIEKNRDAKSKSPSTPPDSCPVCEKFFLSPKDEVYIKKYDGCYECYINFIEGREKRWQSGWRPDKESVFKKT